jgi:hypothetical protein
VPEGFQDRSFGKQADLGQFRERGDQAHRVLIGETLRTVSPEQDRGGGETEKALLGGSAETRRACFGSRGEDLLRERVMRVGRKSESQSDVGIKEKVQGVGDPPGEEFSAQARANRRPSSG